MKTITATELKSILDQHQLWIETKGKEGVCADLTGADLIRANLTGSNLTGADLIRANLTGADLSRADLSGANLRGANLTGANITRANLEGANLSYAKLSRANLTGANLTGTILDKEKKQPDVPPCRVENITSTCQALEKIAKEYGFKIVSIGLEPL